MNPFISSLTPEGNILPRKEKALCFSCISYSSTHLKEVPEAIVKCKHCNSHLCFHCFMACESHDAEISETSSDKTVKEKLAADDPMNPKNLERHRPRVELLRSHNPSFFDPEASVDDRIPFEIVNRKPPTQHDISEEVMLKKSFSCAIALSQDGILYILESGRYLISMTGRDNVVIGYINLYPFCTTSPSGETFPEGKRPSSPLWMQISPANDIYVSFYDRQDIVVLDMYGNMKKRFVVESSKGVTCKPSCFTFDAEGYLHISVRDTSRILVLDHTHKCISERDVDAVYPDTVEDTRPKSPGDRVVMPPSPNFITFDREGNFVTCFPKFFVVYNASWEVVFRYRHCSFGVLNHISFDRHNTYFISDVSAEHILIKKSGERDFTSVFYALAPDGKKGIKFHRPCCTIVFNDYLYVLQTN